MRNHWKWMMLAGCLVAVPALADELSNYPGWTVTKFTEKGKEEENTYTEAKVYWSLKPPDARPPVTVDSRTADRLRNGDANPEQIYVGGGAKTAEHREDEEFVYGKGNRLVVADPVNSTLTSEEGRKDPPVAAEAPRRLSASSSGSSFQGLSNLGSVSGSGQSNLARALQGGGQITSGASLPPGGVAAQGSGAAGAAGGGGGGPALPEDTRRLAASQNQVPVDAGKKTGLAASGVAVNNAAAGFGVSKPKSSKDGEDKDFIVWPNGDPDSADHKNSKPKCESVSKTFDRAQIQRFRVPDGCNAVRIRAWGAGGGGGNYDETEKKVLGGEGGGGAYVYAEGEVDVSKYDLVVVVGGAGGDGVAGKPGDAGFLSGGRGGAAGGGGGGGYSGLFLVERSKVRDDEKPISPETALVVAAGGGGGSSTGERGGAGGGDKGGGGNGAQKGHGGAALGNGRPGDLLFGGAGGNGKDNRSGGGGGGGGFFGGGGGGGVTTDDEGATASAGGGGSSYTRFLNDSKVMMDGKGSEGGNTDFKPRGKAGNAGKAGLVIVEFF